MPDKVCAGVGDGSGTSGPVSVHVIIWPDPHAIAAELPDLADCALSVRVSVLLPEAETGPALARRGTVSEFITLGERESWQQRANLLARQSESEFLLFLASSQDFSRQLLPKLLFALQADSQAAGVYPVWLDSATHKILMLGLVADSQGKLHFLHAGLPADDPLACQKYRVQTAMGLILLLRRADFIQAGGFANQPEIAFLALCLRIHKRTGKFFVTVPDARLRCAAFLASLFALGHWNSWALRGKLPPAIIRPDYFAIARSDGLEMTVTKWLNETTVNCGVDSEPLFAWLHDPNPATLLRWLGTLAREGLRTVFTFCQFLPAFLPLQFHYYEVLAEKQARFASKNNLELMSGAIASWQKARRTFRHSLLIPGMKALQKAGFYQASLDFCPASYDAWLELAEPEPQLQAGADWPRIAIVMPVYNPQPQFLLESIESVLNQSYALWELCVADDASSNPKIREILRFYERKDSRVKVSFRAENGHIALASNSALQLATAPWAAFMDHDDRLAPNALAEVAKRAAAKPQAAIICTDEDNITTDNIRRSPNFRSMPDLHPRGHFFVYKTDLLHAVGGLRSEVNGAQDYDLNLRIRRLFPQAQVEHIAKILYHWRIHPESTAGSSQSKPYIYAATKKAMADDAKARFGHCEVLPTKIPYAFLPAFSLPRNFSASILVLARGSCLDERLLQLLAWQKNNYGISHKIIQRAKPEPDCYSTLARESTASNLLLLDGDLFPLADCRPEQLLFWAAQPEIGAVGSYLYSGQLLWHGGSFPDLTGLPFPLLKNIPKGQLPFCDKAIALFNHYALAPVWHCLATRRELLLAGNAVEPKMGEWSCIDFALKQKQAGRNTLYSPWGQWQWVKEPQRQMPDIAAARLFAKRWANAVKADHLRNANLQAAPDHGWMLKFANNIPRAVRCQAGDCQSASLQCL